MAELMMEMVYVAHPYGGDDVNRKDVERIILELVKRFPDKTFYSPIHATGFLYSVLPYEIGMEHCFAALERCDALLLCDGWEKSRGCKMEYAHAQASGIPIYTMNEFCPDLLAKFPTPSDFLFDVDDVVMVNPDYENERDPDFYGIGRTHFDELRGTIGKVERRWFSEDTNKKVYITTNSDGYILLEDMLIPAIKEPKFAVGDMVKVIRSDDRHGIPVGEYDKLCSIYHPIEKVYVEGGISYRIGNWFVKEDMLSK